VNQSLFLDLISKTVREIHKDIEKLKACNCNKQKVLDNLYSHAQMLDRYIEFYKSRSEQSPPRVLSISRPPETQEENSDRTFTLQELEQYNGQNGNPAYVAVNGVLYDVTNSGSWPSATHFGLIAGRDLTPQYTTCHAGSLNLGRLPVVGKLL
jgi:predicted heme/steroid binding protein